MNCVVLQISLAYAIDSYCAISGESAGSVILVRNTMSFAIGYGITLWVEGMGFGRGFGLEPVFQVASFFGEKGGGGRVEKG